MNEKKYFDEYFEKVICEKSVTYRENIIQFAGNNPRKSKLFKTSDGQIIIHNEHDDEVGLSYLDFASNVWKQSNIDAGDYILVESNNRIIAACGYHNCGICYSDDSGKTWKQSNIEFGIFRGLFVTGYNTIVAARSYHNCGICYSEDNGKTWKESEFDDCGKNYNFCDFGSIGDIIVASGFDCGVYYSDDRGRSWHQTNLKLGGFDTFTTHEDTIVAIRNDYGHEMYWSADGKRWKPCFVEEGATLDFITIGIVGPMMVAGGIKKRIYFSGNNGRTWHKSKMMCNDDVCTIDEFVSIGDCVIAYWSHEPRRSYISKDRGKTWGIFEYGNISCAKVVDKELYVGFNNSTIRCFTTDTVYKLDPIVLTPIRDIEVVNGTLVATTTNDIYKVETVCVKSSRYSKLKDELHEICNGYLDFIKSKKEEEHIEDLCEDPRI